MVCLGMILEPIARVHENKKPFKRVFCDFSALLQAHIKRHIEAVHVNF
jgi:hypothetical protein